MMLSTADPCDVGYSSLHALKVLALKFGWWGGEWGWGGGGGWEWRQLLYPEV